jgi:tRNA threonylcarbamoyladenosine biosynthesis protein TsaB
MAQVLCLETATEICSVALHEDGVLKNLIESTAPYVHSSQITVMVNACLSEVDVLISELDAVAVSAGPGSYTGLRVGASVAKAICYAMQIPLLAIDSLEALAYGVKDQIKEGEIIFSSIDARRQEVYASVYTSNYEVIFSNRSIILDEYDLTEIKQTGDSMVLVGNGSQKIISSFGSDICRNSGVLSSASNMLELSSRAYNQENFSSLAYYAPNYIKPPNITKSRKKLL